MTYLLLFAAVFFYIGHLLRSKIVNSEDRRFVKKKHLDGTHIFCEKYEVKTIILVRFIPIIQIFAPFVAGVRIMPYSKFICYNVIGGIGRGLHFLYGGYLVKFVRLKG